VFVSELVDGRQPERWSEVTLKLAAEVLSPSSFHWDAEVKRRRLQRAGVPEFWVVDVDARSVTVWHPADGRGEVISRRLVWAPVAGVEPLVIDLPEYFAVVRGER
jgi:Uma2 family endonuclease